MRQECRVCRKVAVVPNNDECMLHITYKVGRRTVRETAPYIEEWQDVKEQFTDMLDGDVISDMDFPTYYPEVYWLWKFHEKPSLDGLVESNKRRRR